MSKEDEKKIIDDIINKRRLPYSIEIVDIQGDQITVLNNYDCKMVYIKKGDDYFLKDAL